MPKFKNPPQGGEKYLCLTLFCTMMLSVMSAVAIIYAIVIIYVPAKKVLESNLSGPKMCTTLDMEGNLTQDDPNIDVCKGWTSCVEWCLSKSNKECSHVWAATRELGTEIYWESCDFTEGSFVDHKCNVLEDLEELNCKLYKSEKDANGKTGVGDKDICVEFDDIQISCLSGICKNVSAIYSCTYNDRLRDIEGAWKGKGYCSCNKCNGTGDAYHGECPEPVAVCNRLRGDYNNNATLIKMCANVPCADCKSICSQRGECFDMHSRKDPTVIGTDEFGNSVLTYYTCHKGYCREIYDLKCERRCDSLMFDMRGKNTVIFNGERIIIGSCAARSTAEVSRLAGIRNGYDTLMVACTNVTIDAETNSMISRDCVNGSWFEDNYHGGQTNYSHLIKDYSILREDESSRASEIAYEFDITIYNRTRLKINIDGCVNTLSEECMAFYYDYGKDGRNYTSRAVYPCYYDPENPEYVVINFNPDKTLMLLIFFAAIPGGIMIISCMYMCLCSRFIHVVDDGHMRLRCCGKYVTGIGNVPIWDPPRKNKTKFSHLKH